MTAEAVIIDGYVDEPTCLGVPPYISPYIRYIAGVLHEHDKEARYLTIDQIREDPCLLKTSGRKGLAVMVAGVTVPGKYLGGSPATLTEIQQLGTMLRGWERLLCGPIAYGYSSQGGRKAIQQAVPDFDQLLTGPPAEALDSYLSGGQIHGTPDYRRSDSWSVAGAGIIRQHPNYPWVMIETETAQGCPRGETGGCSFCTEPFAGQPRYRSIEGIADEVRALSLCGARHFRLGRQPDLLVYGSGSGEFPAPRPDLLDQLFGEVRAAAPDLKTLHIDNINPGTIARHEDASREGLRAIVRHHTPGDVAAFGMETADPVVIKENNLKAGPDEVMRAISVVNEEGADRKRGVPELLPGLNLISGLAGETRSTYELNEQFLSRVLASGLLVRRVNIRQLMPFEGTRAYRENTLGKYTSVFRSFKESVRTNFDLPMLRKVFPAATVLSEVIIEKEGQTSFGRQMGSYPILVGFPVHLAARSVTDAVVVDHGMRSVTALPVPVRVNELSLTALGWIPGVGRKRAGRLAAARPLKNLGEFRALAGETPVDPYLSFTSP
ncbi:MAG: radical SAM protein [Methanoregulaceae archaeon]|nr:radical SAM protein [Methanoregulaceae archaeon]